MDTSLKNHEPVSQSLTHYPDLHRSPMDINTAGFEKMPNRMLFDPQLPLAEKLTFLVLQHYARRSGQAFASRQTIGRHLKVSPDRVGGAMRCLEAAGYIRAVARNHGFPTCWSITTDETANAQSTA